METVRVVLDTSVLVAGTRSDRGASRQLLHGVRDRSFTPLVSVPLVSEYEAVLLRSEHLAAAGVTEAEMLALIGDILAAAEAIDRYYLVRPLLRDPADHHVVETAVNGPSRPARFAQHPRPGAGSEAVSVPPRHAGRGVERAARLGNLTMRRNNVSLRLPPHLLEHLKRLAEAEAISVNQLVTVAVAEKIARLDAEAFYRARGDRSDAGAGWRALARMGRNLPPVEGDEVLDA
jgi:predicted nucleic acid-binding protein